VLTVKSFGTGEQVKVGRAGLVESLKSFS